MAEKVPFTIDKQAGVRITIGAILFIISTTAVAANTVTNLQSEITHAQGDIVDLKELTKEQIDANKEISSKLSGQNQSLKDIKSDVADIKDKVYK